MTIHSSCERLYDIQVIETSNFSAEGLGHKMTIVLPKILLNILALNLMGQLVLSVCTGDGPCRCIYNDGSGIVDISSIGNYSGGPRLVLNRNLVAGDE